MTSRSLTVNLGKDGDGNEQTVDVEPYQSWQAGIGGGYEVTMPLDKLGHLKAKLPLDSEPLDDREKLLERFAGYRFVLLAHEGRPKGELRDRVVLRPHALSPECLALSVRMFREEREETQAQATEQQLPYGGRSKSAGPASPRARSGGICARSAFADLDTWPALGFQ